MLYQRSKAKEIIADKDKLDSIVTDTLHNMATIVGATLGPGGRGVLIERDDLPPLVTKDGVTVAKSLGVGKAEANIVIEAAKEICLNTAKEAGDGTTTAIVLADALNQHGRAFLKENPKYNPQRMVNELREVYNSVILNYIKNNSIPAKDKKQLIDVATISANGDKQIAEVVVNAVMAAGDDGHVLIQEGQGDVMRYETLGGYIVTSGLKDIGQIGPVFINDKGNQQVKMDKGLVFLWDGSMNDLKVPALIQSELEGTELYGKPIIVFAHDFSDLVLERFAKTTKGGITVVPVKTSRSGLPNSQSIFLQDMAAYTNGVVYDVSNVEKVEAGDDMIFGTFDNAKINMYETFISATADVERIDSRINELKAMSASAFSEIDRMHLRAAIAKLTGGISTIHVGGSSDLEVREKRARVEDAVEAVRSAVAEGIIPGGCYMHIKFIELLNNCLADKPSTIILIKALQEPIKLLLENCGEDWFSIFTTLGIANKEGKDMGPPTVFDANRHEFVDPLQAGIIEPAKVCRVSLDNALSVASLLITLGGIVVAPRDAGLEGQLEMSKQAFKDMMAGGIPD